MCVSVAILQKSLSVTPPISRPKHAQRMGEPSWLLFKVDGCSADRDTQPDCSFSAGGAEKAVVLPILPYLAKLGLVRAEAAALLKDMANSSKTAGLTSRSRIPAPK